MSLEQYVIRAAHGGPDLTWVAVVDFDTELGLGEIRWKGGLDGLVEPITSRAQLEQQLATWRDVDAHLVDLVPQNAELG